LAAALVAIPLVIPAYAGIQRLGSGSLRRRDNRIMSLLDPGLRRDDGQKNQRIMQKEPLRAFLPPNSQL